MTFAAPLFAWIAGGVAAATIALHLLAWRRPPETLLPTARFAPERPIRMVSRALRPADLALMALRVLLVVLVGVALARPSFHARREGLGRVVVIDRSAAAPGTEIAAAARAVFRPGDAVIVFDSVAREVRPPSPDSLAGPSGTGRGSLSAALVAAIRAATQLEPERDSVEIVVASPVAVDEVDAATRTIRGMWHGPVRVVRPGFAPSDTTSPGRADVRASDGDPVAVALGLDAPVAGGGSVRVVRDALTSADSGWARAGRAVVLWPSAPIEGWETRAATDTAFAVTASAGGAGHSPGVARAATVVAPFVRTASPPAGEVVARWTDGEPAATEAALGAGCVRAVAVTVPAVGDLPLTPAFRQFAARLASPCRANARHALVSDSVLATVVPLNVPAPDRRYASALGSGAPPSRVAAWLLALALLLAVGEMWVRRGGSNATT